MSDDAKPNPLENAMGNDIKHFEMFFERMIDGFAYHKIVLNKVGKPVDYVFLQVNSAFEKMTGLKRDKILGKRVTEVLKGIENDPSDWIGIYGRVAITGKPVEFENFAKPLDKWFKVSAFSPEKGFFVTLFEDITKSKNAEDKLKKINEQLEDRVAKRTLEVSMERQRLYNVLETLPAYVVLLDKDYKVPFANKVFRDQFGESHGRRCYDFLFKRNSPCDNCETYKVLVNNKPHRWEWTGPNGRDYDIYDFPFVEEDGSTLVLEMGVDITERKRAEKRARETADKLKDTERLAAIGATAGMVGHDIRNPLQGITSDIYLARTELASIPNSKEKKNVLESLNEIEKNIEYINKIVQDLQDYARPLNPTTEENDLKQIIERIISKNVVPKNVKVKVKIPDSARKIHADSYYLNRILYNLVNNSIQAMPEGGSLAIQARKEGKYIVIAVVDTGVGIPKENQAKMFTPMFTTKSKGQGFGLPVVKRMVDSLGGFVTFESQEGKGTTFTIHLTMK